MSPQFPDSWVVNPWARWLMSAPSTNSEPSECPCGSMNPGVTTRPPASMTVATVVVGHGRQVTDREDPVPEDANVGWADRAPPDAIDHEAAAQQEVERRHRPMMPSGLTRLAR